jgi:hypothetical protein
VREKKGEGERRKGKEIEEKGEGERREKGTEHMFGFW